VSAIIYLHGFTSGPQSKKAQYFRARFAERGIPIEIPTLDEGRFEELTITSQLGVVERAAQGGPVSLIGSSLGGYLAALYAARHAVGKLVLLAPAFGFARRWPEALGTEQLAEGKRRGYLDVYHYADGRERRLGWGLIDDGMRYEEYPDVRQPTLIIHGIRDDAVPVEYSRAFARGRKNVRLIEMDSDHELLDVVEEVWSESSRFLADGS
jgi:pimeloyl-ACP methyl ester carboxylesterase